MTLIKSISGIRGTIGGSAGDDPRRHSGHIVEIHLDIHRGRGGVLHLVQRGIRPHHVRRSRRHRPQHTQYLPACLVPGAVPVSIVAEDVRAGGLAVGGVGVDGHMQVGLEAVGRRHAVGHGVVLPHHHLHTGALQRRLTRRRDAPALHVLGGVAHRVGVAPLVAGGQIHALRHGHTSVSQFFLYCAVLRPSRAPSSAVTAEMVMAACSA